MKAASVIKAIDIIEDGGGGFGSGGKLTAINQLMLERAPKRLHAGIVVAVTFTTHGSDAGVLSQGLAVSCAGVLASTIGMVKHLADWPALKHRHVRKRPPGDRLGVQRKWV